MRYDEAFDLCNVHFIRTEERPVSCQIISFSFVHIVFFYFLELKLIKSWPAFYVSSSGHLGPYS